MCADYTNNFFYECTSGIFFSILQGEFIPHEANIEDTTVINKMSENDFFASRPQGGLSEEYMERMSTPGVWGDGMVLCCASRLYKRRINLVLSSGRTVEFLPQEVQVSDASPLVLGYVNTSGSSTEDHFIFLRPRGSVTRLDTQKG